MKFKAIGFDYNGVISDGVHIDARMIKLVDSLRKNGYKVGLLSNYGKTGAGRIRESGVSGHFDVFHASGETSLAKPHPDAFCYLAQELEVEITELIYIDDNEYCLSTAKKTGFTPILFTNYEDLVAELEKLGII